MSKFPDKGPSPFDAIGDIVVGKNGVLKQLKGLKVNKAGGPDEIPAIILNT